MKTRPEDLAIIHQHIFPAITGARRLKDFSGTGVHMGYNEAAVFSALLSNLRPNAPLKSAPKPAPPWPSSPGIRRARSRSTSTRT